MTNQTTKFPSVIHVSWGPDAKHLTDDERQAVMDKILTQAAADKADSVPIPVKDLRAIYKALKRLTRIGQATIDEIQTETREHREFRLKVFRMSDFPAMFAGQALPRSVRDEVVAEVKAEDESDV